MLITNSLNIALKLFFQYPGAPAKRLARRARSFKEDLLDKLYQMRSPTSAGNMSPSRGSSPLTAMLHCTIFLDTPGRDA